LSIWIDWRREGVMAYASERVLEYWVYGHEALDFMATMKEA
jgi:hypothetical protein